MVGQLRGCQSVLREIAVPTATPLVSQIARWAAPEGTANRFFLAQVRAKPARSFCQLHNSLGGGNAPQGGTELVLITARLCSFWNLVTAALFWIADSQVLSGWWGIGIPFALLLYPATSGQPFLSFLTLAESASPA